jgi:hypothetical protein
VGLAVALLALTGFVGSAYATDQSWDNQINHPSRFVC